MVVEVPVLPERAQKVVLVPAERAIQQLVSARLHSAFHDRVHSRHLDPAQDDLDPGVLEHSVKQAREFAVAISDQEPRAGTETSRSMTRFFAAWATQDATG
jgi:hypothetical protein